MDMVSQWLLFECSTWTNSSPPTTSNVQVWPSRVFCKPGIPYCFFSRRWAALMMLSFSHRVLLSRICLYSYRVTRVTNNTLCNVSPVLYFTETYLPVFFIQSHAFNNCPDLSLLYISFDSLGYINGRISAALTSITDHNFILALCTVCCTSGNN